MADVALPQATNEIYSTNLVWVSYWVFDNFDLEETLITNSIIYVLEHNIFDVVFTWDWGGV